MGNVLHQESKSKLLGTSSLKWMSIPRLRLFAATFIEQLGGFYVARFQWPWRHNLPSCLDLALLRRGTLNSPRNSFLCTRVHWHQESSLHHMLGVAANKLNLFQLMFRSLSMSSSGIELWLSFNTMARSASVKATLLNSHTGLMRWKQVRRYTQLCSQLLSWFDINFHNGCGRRHQTVNMSL